MMKRIGELNAERIHDLNQIGGLQEENARLKAEVERLDTLCKQVMAQHSDISCENIMLRKAGDAMASSIQFNEEMAQDYNGPTIVHQSVQRWNAAKEGKLRA
jgi:archaellum component FlaC